MRRADHRLPQLLSRRQIKGQKNLLFLLGCGFHVAHRVQLAAGDRHGRIAGSQSLHGPQQFWPAAGPLRQESHLGSLGVAIGPMELRPIGGTAPSGARHQNQCSNGYGESKRQRTVISCLQGRVCRRTWIAKWARDGRCSILKVPGWGESSLKLVTISAISPRIQRGLAAAGIKWVDRDLAPLQAL